MVAGMRDFSNTWLRLSVLAGAGLLATALSGCALPPGQPATAAAVVPAAPADPLMLAVAATPAGRMTSVNTPQYGGAATVSVRSDYVSAAGQECRGYEVTSPATAGTAALACNDGMAWQNVPPLTKGTISGFAP